MTYNGSEKHLENLKTARKVLYSEKLECDMCNQFFWPPGLSRHKKLCKTRSDCPVCGKRIKNGQNKTCSKSCSNTLFRSGENNPNFNPEGWPGAYRRICFNHHKKICVICGEQRIVEVHHLDHNKENNDPSNLIPLCPNHHQYWHSRYRHLVEPKIKEYISEWINNRV